MMFDEGGFALPALSDVLAEAAEVLLVAKVMDDVVAIGWALKRQLVARLLNVFGLLSRFLDVWI